jgi:tRNA threonylcarbamoyladenosine biosynthesis protein TsaE
MAAGLGITEVVTSPTFTLVRSYACPEPDANPNAAPGPGGIGAVRTLLHADVYRLDGLAQVADLDISELVEDDAVCVVEWGDMAAPALGEAALLVNLAPGDTDEVRRVGVTLGGGWAPGRGLPDDVFAPWSAVERPGARR